MTWNNADQRAAAEVTRLALRLQDVNCGWTESFRAVDVVVFSKIPTSRDMKAYVLPDGSGLILGRLFPVDFQRWHSSWEPKLTTADAQGFVASGGQLLMTAYWGSYIAILRHPNGQRLTILRDCSGKIPCYHTERFGIRIAFSAISDLTPLALQPFTLNWQYIAAFIHSGQLQIQECGLREIHEVLAGEAIEISPGPLRQFALWDPRNVARQAPVEDYDEAVNSLRDCTANCVACWGSVFDRIILRLSGGFDSAVVLGCLRASHVQPTITCVNEYSEYAQDDERRFARLAATRANLRLVEQRRNLAHAVFDERVFESPMSCKPTAATIYATFDIDARNIFSESYAANSVWAGEGGDHLFFKFQTELGAADYLQHNGLDLGLVSAVMDSGRLARQPYWWVLRHAWAVGRSHDPWTANSQLNRPAHFVNPEALPQHVLRYVSHPWTLNAEDLPKGKQFQIAVVAEVLNRHRPNPGLDYADEHQPLLAQPLIELCFRIPTYRLLQGGRARALARDAFGSLVPREIIDREDKGDTTRCIIDMLRQSDRFLKETLLDGFLVRERIVDRHSLEPYLAKHAPLRPEHCWPLVSSLAAEVWLRQWLSTSARVAA